MSFSLCGTGLEGGDFTEARCFTTLRLSDPVVARGAQVALPQSLTLRRDGVLWRKTDGRDKGILGKGLAKTPKKCYPCLRSKVLPMSPNIHVGGLNM